MIKKKRRRGRAEDEVGKGKVFGDGGESEEGDGRGTRSYFIETYGVLKEKNLKQEKNHLTTIYKQTRR